MLDQGDDLAGLSLRDPRLGLVHSLGRDVVNVGLIDQDRVGETGTLRVADLSSVEKLPDRLRDTVLTRFLFGSGS